MTILLVISALLPALILCIYMFKKDRVEKEPAAFLFKLLFFGMLCCFPAIVLGDVLGDIINMFFHSDTLDAIDRGIKVPGYYIYNFLYYFIVVALVEESVKFCTLVFATKKSREYDSYFDGLIYAVFVSLGFAAFENVLYVVSNGFYVALLRAVLSVPGHMFFGVMMGYQYSLWHLMEKAQTLEKVLIEEKVILVGKPMSLSLKFKVKGILIPTLAHGFYDFCCSVDSFWATIILLGFVVFMYIHCFKKIRRMSKTDGKEIDYVKFMLASKYPYLAKRFRNGE